jgi:UDP-glucose 4-epimerase|tara:strand:- start:124 stop:1158 length:1035 start_codon:yes stop_codon:yes gene_type:complete
MLQNQNTKNVLVTGGTGYVGSHVCKYLFEQKYNVFVLDRNVEARPFANRYGTYYNLDYNNKNDLEQINNIITTNDISTVFHLAANSLVGPSVSEPLKYYRNNVQGTLNLLELCVNNNIKKFVFASTSSVYGDGHQPPISETAITKPLTSYGRSKLMVEGMLSDFHRAYGLKSVALRLFNVCGSAPDYDLGEVRIKPTHLIPNLVEVVAGRKQEFSVFGNDYATPDGTAIRDYTHVWDVAKAFGNADQLLDREDGHYVFNIGAGKGFSVKEVITAMERAVGKDIPVKEEPRREGDPSHVSANVDKAIEHLKWQPTHSEIDTICEDTVKWLDSETYKEIDLEKIPS